jgi:hypothetical protein
MCSLQSVAFTWRACAALSRCARPCREDDFAQSPHRHALSLRATNVIPHQTGERSNALLSSVFEPHIDLRSAKSLVCASMVLQARCCNNNMLCRAEHIGKTFLKHQ